jgi:hypothetical protein
MTDQHATLEVFGRVDTQALTHHEAVVDAIASQLADK